MTLAVRPNLAGCASEADTLDVIVKALVRALDPRCIWLFGSRASGRAQPESDFDLLVVGKPGSFSSEDYDLVDRAIRDLRVACDLVPCASSDFDEGKLLRTSFISEILRTGRPIYQAENA